jgi:RNA recognition motif-containing protein
VKIIIRNLSRNTTEPEVNDLFSAFGEVTSCDLVMDKVTGGSKGFGFVEMPNDKHAKYAIKNLNDKTVAGSRIRVKVAEERK